MYWIGIFFECELSVSRFFNVKLVMYLMYILWMYMPFSAVFCFFWIYFSYSRWYLIVLMISVCTNCCIVPICRLGFFFFMSPYLSRVLLERRTCSGRGAHFIFHLLRISAELIILCSMIPLNLVHVHCKQILQNNSLWSPISVTMTLYFLLPS